VYFRKHLYCDEDIADLVMQEHTFSHKNMVLWDAIKTFCKLKTIRKKIRKNSEKFEKFRIEFLTIRLENFQIFVPKLLQPWFERATNAHDLL